MGESERGGVKADGLAIHLYRGGWRVGRFKAGVATYDEALPDQDGKAPEECAEGEESHLFFIREGVMQSVKLERGKIVIPGITAPLVVEGESEPLT